MIDTNKRLVLSIPEAAAALGISKNLAYELARQGKLPGCLKIGQRRLVVSKSQLEAYLRGGNGGHQEVAQ